MFLQEGKKSFFANWFQPLCSNKIGSNAQEGAEISLSSSNSQNLTIVCLFLFTIRHQIMHCGFRELISIPANSFSFKYTSSHQDDHDQNNRPLIHETYISPNQLICQIFSGPKYNLVDTRPKIFPQKISNRKTYGIFHWKFQRVFKWPGPPIGFHSWSVQTPRENIKREVPTVRTRFTKTLNNCSSDYQDMWSDTNSWRLRWT